VRAATASGVFLFSALAIGAVAFSVAVHIGVQPHAADEPEDRGDLSIELAGHTSQITSLAYSPDGRWLASASYDKSIRLWRPDDPAPIRELNAHSQWVMDGQFHPKGGRFASAGNDFSIILWDAERGLPLRTLLGHESGVEAVAWSRDGSRLVSAGRDRTARVWNPADGSALHVLRGHPDELHAVAVAADGRTLAAGVNDGSIWIWNIASGQLLQALRGHSSAVETLEFSSDGGLLASGSADTTIRLWNASTWKEERTLPRQSAQAWDRVNDLAFSPDGRWLAAATFETLVLWDLRGGIAPRRLRGPGQGFQSVAFSADSKRLAAGAGSSITVIAIR
jgi:WD40 repeat protein